jgi:hypothetical protein
MARIDEFKIAPDDGYRYQMPERDRDRQDREAGYVILALVVLVVMLATATGHIMVFAQY